MVSDLIGEWVEWVALDAKGIESTRRGKVRAVYADCGPWALVEAAGELVDVPLWRARIAGAPA